MRKLLEFLAVAGLLVIAAPAQRAEAAVLAPGVATALQGSTESLATDVRWRRHGGFRRHYGFRRPYFAPRRYYRPRYYRRRFF